jgi:hypothetical protein
MYIAWFLNAITYITVIIYLSNNDDASLKVKSILLRLALGFCFFNIVQRENILWGFQIGFFMVAAFSVICLFFFYKWLEKNNPLYFMVSIMAGIIASFSSIHGLFVFPVMLFNLILLFFSKEKDSKRGILLMAIISVCIYAFYFYNYHKPQHHPDFFGGSLINILIYFIVALGGFSGNIFFAVPVGLLVFFGGLSLAVYLLKKKRIKNNIFPLALLFYGYLFCISITMGRVGFGVGQAFSSRYTTFSMLSALGFILLVYNEFISNNKKHYKKAFYCLYILLSIIVINNFDIVPLKKQHDDRKNRQYELLHYKEQSLETLQVNYPWKNLEDAYKDIGILKERKWSLFAEK